MRHASRIFVTTPLLALMLTPGTPTYAQQSRTHLRGRPSDLVSLHASDVAPGTSAHFD